MRFTRLTKTGQFSDQWGEWVVCTDINKQEWTVPQAVYDQFKYLGLPTIDKEMEAEFNQLLKGKHYPKLPKEVRYRMIKQMLERCTQEPIEFLFPNI